MHQHPLYQLRLKGGYDPLVLVSYDWLGSTNSPVYQLQLKGGYDPLGFSQHRLTGKLRLPLFTSFNWKEATTSCRQLACPCTTQPPFINNIGSGSSNFYEIFNLPRLLSPLSLSLWYLDVYDDGMTPPSFLSLFLIQTMYSMRCETISIIEYVFFIYQFSLK